VLEEALDDGQVASGLIPWAKLTRVLAAYRLGHYEEASQLGRKVQESGLFARGEAQALLVRAMAEHRLKHDDEARRVYTQAVKLRPGRLRTLGEPASSDRLDALSVGHDWLMAEVLRREAEKLLSLSQP